MWQRLYHLGAGPLDKQAEAGGGGRADPSPCLIPGNLDEQAELEGAGCGNTNVCPLPSQCGERGQTSSARAGLAVAKGTCLLTSVRRPDITVMVDWAFKINYLSIYLSQCEEFGHILEKFEKQ